MQLADVGPFLLDVGAAERGVDPPKTRAAPEADQRTHVLAAARREVHQCGDVQYAAGEHAGVTGDKYIRVTVILASVLFIVGISSHFPLRGVRIGLVDVVWTGEQFLLVQNTDTVLTSMDTAGRVERFRQKYARNKPAEAKDKAATT